MKTEIAKSDDQLSAWRKSTVRVNLSGQISGLGARFRALSGAMALLALSACATFESMPPGFLYETSLRGEQGYPGRAARVTAANALLEAGTVTHPGAALRSAFPNQDIKIRQWGLRYFNADWTRYQIVLDADIGSGEGRVKCRERSPDTPVGAPTLPELLSHDGAELQRQLDSRVAACVVYARDLT